ncbi:MAG: EutN/CcmL family microcompartment protein [Myxococcota bacterium]|nr:EutN/CcmL family microcompartment protein [Myxococcota bacterium]
MKVARVIGSVVSTIKAPTYEGRKLLLCEHLDHSGVPLKSREIAVDLVQAGVGDRVLIMSEGNGIRQLLGADAGPIRDVIVGIIDTLAQGASEVESSEERER